MPVSGFMRQGFSRSAKKSAREILHSINMERQEFFQPITSGVSPLAHDCSESTMPQRYFLRSHCSASRTICWWVMRITCTAEMGKRTVPGGLLAQKFFQGRFVFFFFLPLLVFCAAHRRRRPQQVARNGLHSRGGAKDFRLFLRRHTLI